MSAPLEDRHWLRVLLTYSCDTCGAQQGDMCVTKSGKRADVPHAARERNMNRCRRCGTRLPADSTPGDYCGHCSLYRSLIVERYTPHHRIEP